MIVHSCSLDDARLLALGENTKTRLPLTSAERSDVAWRLVCLGETYSKRQTVEASGVKALEDSRHSFCVDPAPNGMTMPPSFLFVKDDDAGLVSHDVLFFDGCNRLFKGFDSNGLGLGWIERDRKKKLPALRTFRDGFSFAECSHDIIGHETSDIVDFDMLVLGCLQKMKPELLGTAALGTFEDHDDPRSLR